MSANEKELQARWETEDGRDRLSRILDGMRDRYPWWEILVGFLGVEEIENGRDFRGVKLGRAELNNTDLSDIDFSGANLCGAKLSHTLLDNTIFHRANLSAADLTEASFRGTDFTDANLSGADLSGANLTEAVVNAANFSEANLRGANISDNDLISVNLSAADLTEADLMDSVLKDVNFSDAILSQAHLSGASLENVDFSGADLSQTMLFDVAELTPEDEEEFRARGARLSEVDIGSAPGDTQRVGGLSSEKQNARSVYEIIEEGETKRVEFKSTLRFHLRVGRNDNEITHEVLKTIAAFLNSDGGQLLIGVEDSGKILGLENDGFKNADKFQLYLLDKTKTAMGDHAATLLGIQMPSVDGNQVCLVECAPSPVAIYVKNKNDDDVFYVRTGPATTQMNTSEVHGYVKNHFK